MTTQAFEELKSHMTKPVNMNGTQCECLKQIYRPFILGGDTHPVSQCPNDAVYKVTSHAEHEKDMPPMYLCDECIKLFKTDNKEYLSDYEIVKIKVKKK